MGPAATEARSASTEATRKSRIVCNVNMADVVARRSLFSVLESWGLGHLAHKISKLHLPRFHILTRMRLQMLKVSIKFTTQEHHHSTN